jgi:hypothetical protein
MEYKINKICDLFNQLVGDPTSQSSRAIPTRAEEGNITLIIRKIIKANFT